jgi:hypothetical protein
VVAVVLTEEGEQVMTIWEAMKKMSKEEFAEWLYANCEYISAEYGACSGENDSSGVLRLLDSAMEGDW